MSILFNVLINEIEANDIISLNEKLYMESLNSMPADEEKVQFDSIIVMESIIENEGKIKELFRKVIRLFKFNPSSKMAYDVEILKDVNPDKVGSSNKKMHVRQDTFKLVCEILDRGDDPKNSLATIVSNGMKELGEYNEFIKQSMPTLLQRIFTNPNFTGNSKLKATSGLKAMMFGALIASLMAEKISKGELDANSLKTLNIMGDIINSFAGNSADNENITDRTIQKLKDINSKLASADLSPYDATPESQKVYATYIKNYQPNLYASALIIKELSKNKPIKKAALIYDKFKKYTAEKSTYDIVEKLANLIEVLPILDDISKNLGKIFEKIVEDMRNA